MYALLLRYTFGVWDSRISQVKSCLPNLRSLARIGYIWLCAHALGEDAFVVNVHRRHILEKKLKAVLLGLLIFNEPESFEE